MEQKIITRSYSSLMWGIVTIAAGLVLMIWPHAMLKWAVRLMGITLLILGIVQFLGFLVRTRKEENRWKYFPAMVIVTVVSGALLLLLPEFWVAVSAILCGLVLIVLAMGQIVTLVKLRKSGIKVLWGYYAFPVLLIMAGLVVIPQPITAGTWFIIFSGAWILAYGVIEVFEFFTLREPREVKSTAVEVKVVEDTDSEEVK